MIDFIAGDFPAPDGSNALKLLGLPRVESGIVAGSDSSLPIQSAASQGTMQEPPVLVYISTSSISSGARVRLRPNLTAGQVGTLRPETVLLLTQVLATEEGALWGKVHPAMVDILSQDRKYVASCNWINDGFTALMLDNVTYWRPAPEVLVCFW